MLSRLYHNSCIPYVPTCDNCLKFLRNFARHDMFAATGVTESPPPPVSSLPCSRLSPPYRPAVLPPLPSLYPLHSPLSSLPSPGPRPRIASHHSIRIPDTRKVTVTGHFHLSLPASHPLPALTHISPSPRLSRRLTSPAPGILSLHLHLLSPPLPLLAYFRSEAPDSFLSNGLHTA